MVGSDSGNSEPAETIKKNETAEGSSPSAVEVNAAPNARQQKEPGNASVPPPSKITLVRSQKSRSVMPAMQPLEAHTATSTANSTMAAEPELPANNAPAAAPGTLEPDSGARSAALPVETAPSAAAPPATSRSNFPENLSASRQNINAQNLQSQEISHTKLSFPAPDQPVPMPQAPPQFLGDQGLTRPADNTLERSQFGTASEFGGAPIALLTNFNRGKNDEKFGINEVVNFIKTNLIACILALSMVVLAVLILTNKDFRGDSKVDAIKSMDLTILSTGLSLEQVNQLMSAKRYQEALALCDKIIQKDPKFAEGYHSRGQIYMAMHRYHEAVDDLTTAESFNHRSLDIHIDRAAALFQAQDFEKAKREYEQIIELDKNNSPAYFGKGLVEENIKQPDEALADFKKSLELQPNYSAAHEELGTIYFNKGELSKSYDEYTKAINISPEAPRFYFNRANALKQDHQIKRAIADYCKAIQLDGSSPEFFNNRGLLYLENNETTKAITDFSSAVDLDPNYTIAKHNLTLAQERLRR